MTIATAAAPAVAPRTSSRIRTPVPNTGMLDSSHPGFSAALTLPAPASPSKSQGLHSKRKHKNAELRAGTLAALLPDTQEDGEGDDEQEQSADDADGSDDNAQHDHRKPAAAAAASTRGPRVQWKADAEEQLQNALLEHVQQTGRLPAQLKTGKHVPVNADWKGIAARVTKLKLTGPAAAKACSTKWAKIKKELKVRSSLSLSAASLADLALITSLLSVCLLVAAGTLCLRCMEGARVDQR
jgi:hypothetical protein